jgi:dihydroneopterin aldolase
MQQNTYHFNEIRLQIIIGLHEHERLAPQTVLFSLWGSFNEPNLSENTLNQLVQKTLQDYCQKERPLLLERMAYELGLLLWHKLPEKSWILLEIKKPQALKEAECSIIRARLEK